MADLIIKNANVVDGTGANAYRTDIAVTGGRIERIGALGDMTAARVIDADGATVTPGFIDPHTHVDLSVLFANSMSSYLHQGVTTMVAGNCGHGMAPVSSEFYRSAIVDTKAMFEADPSYFDFAKFIIPKEAAAKALKNAHGIDLDWTTFGEYIDKVNSLPIDGNIVPLAAYSSIRGAVMGMDCCREATEEEIAQMERMTRECFEDGAYGLSTGRDPQYIPGPFATRDETLRMLRIVKEYDAIFSSHTANLSPEGVSDQMGGYREMLELALETGVRANVSHVHSMLSGTNAQERAEYSRHTLAYFEEMEQKGVDLSYDVIPSPYSTNYTVPRVGFYLKPFVLMSGSHEQLAKNLRVPDFRQMIKDVAKSGKYIMMDESQPMNIYTLVTVLRHKNPAYIGKTTTQIANGADLFDTLMDVFVEDPTMWADIGISGCEESNEILSRHRLAIPCADGISGGNDFNFGLNDEVPTYQNPMNVSYAIRYITLHGKPRFEDTIRQMTSYPAERFGIENRGVLREGAFADIVILRPEALKSYDCDETDFLRYPDGISHVIVGGEVTIENGRHTGAAAGKMLRRGRGE